MAKHKIHVPADLPEVGTVYAVPLADGRTGVCRVLRRTMEGTPRALVAASDWISSKAPPLDHPAVRRILVKNHHNWRNSPDVMWVTTPPPKGFRIIGKISVTAEDAKTQSNSYGGWESITLQILAQWRWDNERAAVFAEDEVKEAVKSAKMKEEIQRRIVHLSKVSFSDLLAKDLFPTWSEYPPKAAKIGCQKIIRFFVQTLSVAEKPLSKEFVSLELQKCVERLNQLDTKHGGFIETIEREDICGTLEEVVNAAKFPLLVDKVEDWRDW